MPSREDIAGWLREMEQEYKEIADGIRGPFRGPVLKDQIKWGKRAAQVENMRCGNCSRLFIVTGGDGEGIPCPWSGSGGCWRFKQKEN